MTNKSNRTEALKAGALMCPTCCVELLEIEVDFEDNGNVLPNVKVLRCPICEVELFTPEQQKALMERIHGKG